MGELLLGAHASISGGTPLAIGRAEELGATACQIFVKSPNQWRARAIAAEEAAEFRARQEASAVHKVVAHAAYLINLAAVDAAVRERSIAALADELERSRQLGLSGLVVHPGAHLGAGEAAGISRIARSIDRVIERVAADCPPILLENTAGQGTVLGYRLEQLAEMIEGTRQPGRLGVCLDTCHALAAGYRVDTAGGIDALLEAIHSLFGLGRLGAVHLNDSRYPLGSRRDRHANIGEGEIGLEGFRHLMNSPGLDNVPLLLETPLGDDEQGHRRDLETLRGLVADGR
jgi:deoxyribonuclease-4